MLTLQAHPAVAFPNGRHIAAFAARGTGPRPAEDAATVGFEAFGLPIVVSSVVGFFPYSSFPSSCFGGRKAIRSQRVQCHRDLCKTAVHHTAFLFSEQKCCWLCHQVSRLSSSDLPACSRSLLTATEILVCPQQATKFVSAGGLPPLVKLLQVGFHNLDQNVCVL